MTERVTIRVTLQSDRSRSTTANESLAAEIDRLKISSITAPALGCGLGGLDWQAVRKELEGGLCGCKTCKIIVFDARESNARIQSSRKGNFEIDSVKGTADNS